MVDQVRPAPPPRLTLPCVNTHVSLPAPHLHRHFVLSVKYESLFFWSGDATQATSRAKRIALRTISHLHREADRRACGSRMFVLKVSSGASLRCAAATPADAAVWVSTLQQHCGPHVAVTTISRVYRGWQGRRMLLLMAKAHTPAAAAGSGGAADPGEKPPPSDLTRQASFHSDPLASKTFHKASGIRALRRYSTGAPGKGSMRANFPGARVDKDAECRLTRGEVLAVHAAASGVASSALSGALRGAGAKSVPDWVSAPSARPGPGSDSLPAVPMTPAPTTGMGSTTTPPKKPPSLNLPPAQSSVVGDTFTMANAMAPRRRMGTDVSIAESVPEEEVHEVDVDALPDSVLELPKQPASPTRQPGQAGPGKVGGTAASRASMAVVADKSFSPLPASGNRSVSGDSGDGSGTAETASKKADTSEATQGDADEVAEVDETEEGAEALGGEYEFGEEEIPIVDAWGRWWTQHSDGEDVWYVNCYTGDSTWEAPENALGTVEYPWETVNDEDGDEFFMNKAVVTTKEEIEAGEAVPGSDEAIRDVPESQWEPPPGWAKHHELLQANGVRAAVEGRFEWTYIVDEDGDGFYVHILTGVSQWEEPAGWPEHLAYVEEHGEGSGCVEAPEEGQEEEEEAGAD